MFASPHRITIATNTASGDSYSWNGLTTSGPQPSSSNPIGVPYPGSTSSNGPNWVDFLATVYNQSLILTYDFAFPGATVDASIVASSTYPVISMAQQVTELYLPHHASNPNQASWTAEDSLFAFFIGINDIGFSYSSDDNLALQAVIFPVYKRLVDQVYASGARNFLFLMVPPVNRAPLTAQLRSSRASLRSARAIADWNRRLVDLAANLTRASDGATAWVFDTNGLFNQIIDGPRQYTQTSGLVVTDDYCPLYSRGTSRVDTWLEGCVAPVNGYFWLNSLHPTYPVHHALASEIANMMSREKLCPSIWELVAGGRDVWG